MFIALENQKHTVVCATINLLKQLRVNVSKASIAQQLEDHPNYPTILCSADCLNDWGVENDMYNIIKEEYNIADLLFPFIAPLKDKSQQFIVVKNIENGIVHFSSDKLKSGKMPEADFLNQWNYTALHAIPHTNSGEQNYNQKQFKQYLKNAIAPTAVVILFILIFSTLTTSLISVSTSLLTAYSILIFLKLCGLVVSTLLLIQSINGNNPFIKNICSLGGKNNCNALLKTPAAKVTDWLSWSEVGFFYFAGSLLSLLFASSSIILLAWINLLALPFTVYSISYQYKHKNWCILCCAIQAVLVLEAISFYWLLDTYNLKLTTYNLILITCIFLLPVVTWSFLKPFFVAAIQLKPAKKQLNKFKYNTELFNKALTSQAKFAMGAELKPIILGNPTAANVIIMVSNPFCSPCAQAHQALEEWLKIRDDLQLNVIITAEDNDNTKRKEMALHINALNASADKSMLDNALNEWFGLKEKDHAKWMVKYPVLKSGDENELLASQKKGCDIAEVSVTPTIFLNGYKLPEPYNWQDLKYLIT